MLLRMKFLGLGVAVLLVGCASPAEIAEFGKVVKQASGAAQSSGSGSSTGSGSVASGGTGYLPCPTGPAPTTPNPDCK